MIVRSQRFGPVSRRGTTLVEFAVVASLFFLFLFGIFEYCRYLLVLHITTNAVRDGARYAVVNLDKPASFPTTPHTFSYAHPVTGATVTRNYPAIRTVVNTQMAGLDRMITGYSVTVFPCDTTQLYATPPVIQPKSGASAWNDAAFSERIGVRVSGTYKPLLPNFLSMNSSLPFNIVAVAGSEG